MKRSYWSKVVGAGVFAVSLAVLPLANPASAQTQSSGMSRGDIDARWMSAREFYWMGRHEWRGEGLMSQLRSRGMMMQRQSVTNPGTGTGTTIIERRDTTITPGTPTAPGTTITPDTTITPGTTTTPGTP